MAMATRAGSSRKMTWKLRYVDNSCQERSQVCMLCASVEMSYSRQPFGIYCWFLKSKVLHFNHNQSQEFIVLIPVIMYKSAINHTIFIHYASATVSSSVASTIFHAVKRFCLLLCRERQILNVQPNTQWYVQAWEDLFSQVICARPISILMPNNCRVLATLLGSCSFCPQLKSLVSQLKVKVNMDLCSASSWTHL